MFYIIKERYKIKNEYIKIGDGIKELFLRIIVES